MSSQGGKSGARGVRLWRRLEAFARRWARGRRAPALGASGPALRVSLGCSFTAVALTGLSGWATPSAADSQPPEAPTRQDRVRYVIRRNGAAIGTHHCRFIRRRRSSTAASTERSPERPAEALLRIEHRVRVRVRVLMMEAYRYDLDSVEHWHRGRLRSMRARTNRNGQRLRVSVRRFSGGLRVWGRAGTSDVSHQAVPSAPHYNVFPAAAAGARPFAMQMVDAEEGKVLAVRVRGPAPDQLSIGGRTQRVVRYRVSGDSIATLWYRSDGTLVKKRLRAPDGSTVITVLEAQGG